jgi:hypothetical protein
MKRVLVGVLLIPAMVLVAGLALRSDEILNFILRPVDDPQYLCFVPDASPLTGLASSTVLQECSAGKTVNIARGETIAVISRTLLASIRRGPGTISTCRPHQCCKRS